MIEVQSLTKHFGPIHAVNGVSFSVAKGEVLGFLGPNGAGKSTTMKMITGFLTPTSGTARICGNDIQARPIRAKKHIGYLPEGAPLYADMTPVGFLGFIANARGIRGREKRHAVDRAIDLTQLGGVVGQPIETLSKGFKRRVGLAQALLHDPDVLILDEPTDGLDPNQKHDVRKIIRDMAPEKSIVISTHILEEVGAVCSRALIIVDGVVVADGTPAELQARASDHNTVTITLKAPPATVAQTSLLGLDTVDRVELVDERTLRVFPSEGRSIAADVSQLARDNSWLIDGLHVEQGTMDDVFRQITLNGKADGKAQLGGAA
jgi:ABC-2 type transport system ATP-binding protein